MPYALPELTPEASLLALTRLERWDADGLTLLEWGRRFLPVHCPAADAPFHVWLSDSLSTFHSHRGSRLAIIAPRGSAKSTWVTLAYVLRCVVEAREPYVLILSDTADQAEQFLATVRDEITSNEDLAAVYPEACGKLGRGGLGRGGLGRIHLRNGVQIRALGRGNPVRGRKAKQHRPSLIVLDDCQRNEDVTSSTLRDAAIAWLLSEVIPAGSNTTNYVSVGSALHRDAISVRAQALPGWVGRTWPAVESWPDRLDLWQEWELRGTNLADEDRVSTAAAYLAANRAAMMAGGRSYWPGFKPLDLLMGTRAEIGPRRFLTEFQGVPLSPEGTEWPPEYFDRKDLWFDVWPGELVYVVVALDPSKGQRDTPGDYQAHAVVGMDAKGGLWAEVVCQREPVPEMVARCIELARLHKAHCVAIETNQGLDLLLPEFERQAKERRLLQPLQGVLQTENKAFRIRRLDAYLSRHQIRVRNTPGGKMLVEQLREFPLGDHDDAPDALELGIRRLELLASGQ